MSTGQSRYLNFTFKIERNLKKSFKRIIFSHILSIFNKKKFSIVFRCYCRALNLAKDSALLWHDIACCYLSQLQFDSSVNRVETAKKCLASAKQAVTLNPSNWLHWNILAVVCMTKEIKNYALAQHCFIMAIDREPNNGIAWTNLGTLYLRLGKFFSQIFQLFFFFVFRFLTHSQPKVRFSENFEYFPGIKIGKTQPNSSC